MGAGERSLSNQQSAGLARGAARYCVSFSAGGLLRHQSLVVARLYLELGQWDAVRGRVCAENTLQARAPSTLRKLYREVAGRLRTLSAAELAFFVNASYQDRAYMLWLAVCRRYRLIADFAAEVLRVRYLEMRGEVNYRDFDEFFNRKAEWHPELDRASTATRKSLRMVLFRMLREAGLLSADYAINAVVLGPEMVAAIPRARRSDLAWFPVSARAIREVAR